MPTRSATSITNARARSQMKRSGPKLPFLNSRQYCGRLEVLSGSVAFSASVA